MFEEQCTEGKEVAGGRRTLHDKLHNLHISADIIGMIKSRNMNEVCSTHTRGDSRYKTMVGTFEGKRPFGRPRHRWKNSSTVYLKINNVRGCGLDLFGFR